jgi:hypothetical protein
MYSSMDFGKGAELSTVVLPLCPGDALRMPETSDSSEPIISGITCCHQSGNVFCLCHPPINLISFSTLINTNHTL